MTDPAKLREQILELVAAYHDAQFAQGAFEPGASAVPVSGKVFDADELLNLVDASLDFWLTTGRYARRLGSGSPSILWTSPLSPRSPS